MSRLSSKEKGEVQCILMAFNFSAFDNKVGTKLSRHYKSFVGRDFKALGQCTSIAISATKRELFGLLFQR